jgi:hypothetical protein
MRRAGPWGETLQWRAGAAGGCAERFRSDGGWARVAGRREDRVKHPLFTPARHTLVPYTPSFYPPYFLCVFVLYPCSSLYTVNLTLFYPFLLIL